MTDIEFIEGGLPPMYISSVRKGHARMKDVNVTGLRQNLPEYLARVQRGERLRVTTRGRAIAEIGRPSTSREEAEAVRRERLVLGARLVTADERLAWSRVVRMIW